ncbi:hypothetical protein NMG60_11000504 [Bertholletia excelsa]
MANCEESSPLLAKQPETEAEKKAIKPATASLSAATAEKRSHQPSPLPKRASGMACGWTADGLPLGQVVGEPMQRSQWNSSIFACLGRNDEFCSSDLEVCLLGSVAPCVIYGSNVERLGSAPGTFANHCLTYSGLYLLGRALFGSNILAPCFSYHSRTAIRRKFNLEGSCEALNRSCGCCGCCGSFVEDDAQLEQCEICCDIATHIFCHRCAVCQEGRELRRRLPHPGFNAQPVLIMIPPGQQAMSRGSA